MRWNVSVTRTSVASHDIEVEADTREEAEEKALEAAGNLDYSGCVVDYDFDVGGSTPVNGEEEDDCEEDEPQPSSDDLVCLFCDATQESVLAAMQAGWIPSFLVGETRQDGPVCRECCAKCLSADERGKAALKPECALGQYVRFQGGREFKCHCIVNMTNRMLVIYTTGNLPGRLADEHVVVDGVEYIVCPRHLRDSHMTYEQAQMFFSK